MLGYHERYVAQQMKLPEPFDRDFRAATNSEIRSWSFGRITKQRVSQSASLDDAIGTLADQRIFGPSVANRCPCGKYGSEYIGMICDICGVKVTHIGERRKRFGHVEFGSGSVNHPFDSSVSIDCFPVIPATYLESQTGNQLCGYYEQLLSNPDALMPLVEFLSKMAAASLEWNTEDASIFTRGIALVLKNAT